MLQREGPSEEKQRQEALDPQDPTGRVLREAANVFQSGDADEALAMLEEESALQPSDPHTMYLAAQILVETARGKQALVVAETAIQLAPTFAQGYFIRGQVLKALGRAADARRDFARALKLDPRHRQAAESLEQPARQWGSVRGLRPFTRTPEIVGWLEGEEGVVDGPRAGARQGFRRVAMDPSPVLMVSTMNQLPPPPLW